MTTIDEARQPQPSGAADLRELASRLFRVGDDLPGQVMDAVLQAGGAAVPYLVQLLRTGPIAPPNSYPTQLEFGVLHAIELLGEIGCPSSVGPLLAILRRGGENVRIGHEVWSALSKIGRPALDQVLDFHETVGEAFVRDALTRVVADSQVQDERTLAVMVAALRRDPERHAQTVIESRHRGVLPEAHRLLASANPVHEWGAVLALADVIEELGDGLCLEESTKRAVALEARDRSPLWTEDKPPGY
jgi:hypothetical protein